MIVEILAILVTLVAGTAVLRISGLRGWGLLPLGFIAGTALYIAVGLVQVVARFPTSPVWTMLATGLVPLAVWAVLAWRGRDVGVSWKAAALSVAGVVALTVLLRLGNMFAWHVDTHDYLGMGAQLAGGSFEEFPRQQLLTARLLGIPLVHAPASLTDDYYLRSAVPLLALATFAAIVWFFHRGTSHLVDRRTVTVLTVLGLAFLLTSNRVVHHVFYVNGHLMTGTFVLLIAASAWLLATRRNGVEPRTLVVLLLVTLPALVITRPEGAVMGLIALFPLVVSAGVPVRVRSAALVTLGLPMLVWFGYVHVLLTGSGDTPDRSTAIMFMAGAALCAAGALLPVLPWLKEGLDVRRRIWVIGAAEAAMWVALAAFTLRDPAMMQRSIPNTAKNQIVAGWGFTILALMAFAILAAFMLRNHWTTFLRFPVTTFLPLVFLLAYLRDGGYRLGPTDSLNRMWIQVVPIAVLYALAAIALTRSSAESGEGSPASDGAPAPRREQ